MRSGGKRERRKRRVCRSAGAGPTVPLGDSLPAVRRQLAGKPVRPVRDQGLTCWPSTLSWCRPGLRRSGQCRRWGAADRQCHCLRDSRWLHWGNRHRRGVEGVHLPLCWHHDNEHRNGQLPIRLADVAGWLAQLVLQRVAGWCGVAAADLTARICAGGRPSIRCCLHCRIRCCALPVARHPSNRIGSGRPVVTGRPMLAIVIIALRWQSAIHWPICGLASMPNRPFARLILSLRPCI